LQLAFGLVLLILAAIVQATVLTRIPLGVRPDLVLVVVLAWSMIRDVSEATVAGIAGGMALDLLSGVPFGLHTGLLGLIGSITALGEAYLFRGNLPIFSVSAALATILLHGGSLLVLQAAGEQTLGLPRFIQMVVPTAMLNALLMPLGYLGVQRWVRALGGWRQLEL
jgi:rod shape-determining protein MreD